MKLGSTLAAVILVLVGLAHILRLTLELPITVGTTAVPMWVSVVGAIVALLVAFLLWKESRVSPIAPSPAPR